MGQFDRQGIKDCEEDQVGAGVVLGAGVVRILGRGEAADGRAVVREVGLGDVGAGLGAVGRAVPTVGKGVPTEGKGVGCGD